MIYYIPLVTGGKRDGVNQRDGQIFDDNVSDQLIQLAISIINYFSQKDKYFEILKY